MKFINREAELRYLNEAKELASKKLFSVSIYGLRRVGKTRLILESLNQRDLYFFVNKDKTSESLLKEYEGSLKSNKILTEFEILKSWEDFFKILFERYKGIVVFDEFQNFIVVDKSIFGILQKYIDLHENKKGLFFIFSGSTIGLIKKLFSDSKEPLYGRLKRSLRLEPFSFSNTVKICKELGIKDIAEMIRFYSIFGGFPKYYVSIEDENLIGKASDEILDKFLFVENAIYEEEIATILALEFGKRSGLYHDILTAVADGCTKISEIASYLRKKETALTRQINELVRYFNLIDVERQIIGKKKILRITHPLMNFWFKFFYKNISSYKKREKWLITKIKEEINSYVGHRFEYVCKEFLIRLGTEKKLPFDYTAIGKQWGKIPGKQKGENQYEIDIIVLNKKTKQILFCECKWKDKVDPNKILSELREKAQYVDWYNKERKEYFAIFAKSFNSNKRKIKEKNVFMFDLKDIEKLFK